MKEATTDNFRNLKPAEISFSAGANIITGPNGAGKTNILEAVVLSASAYSFRTRSLSEAAAFGHNTFRTAVRLQSESGLSVEASSTFTQGGRLRHRVIPRVTIPVTVFTPDDLRIVKGGPGNRRMYLDQLLFTTSAAYRHNWQRYRAQLAQRNSLLKQVRSSRSSGQQFVAELETWDEQLVKTAAHICQYRARACVEIQQHIVTIHQRITGDNAPVALSYSPAASFPEDDTPATTEQWIPVLAHALKRSRERDLRTATTGTGPHRDDVSIELGGQPVRDFGSQGQQRTLSLCLRLAQHLVAEHQAEETGILLLDDVASELDVERRTRLSEVTEGRQIIITTTDHTLFPPADLLLSVAEGVVTQQ